MQIFFAIYVQKFARKMHYKLSHPESAVIYPIEIFCLSNNQLLILTEPQIVSRYQRNKNWVSKLWLINQQKTNY